MKFVTAVAFCAVSVSAFTGMAPQRLSRGNGVATAPRVES
jgi:hypothetical protein